MFLTFTKRFQRVHTAVTVCTSALLFSLPLTQSSFGDGHLHAGDHANADAGPVIIDGSLVEIPQVPQSIMTVEEIRVGMKGYGMTVFHGTKIEPFRVEVVSVQPTNTPARAVIWVRCLDDRINVSGPVQGMSGSPIYLWEDGEDGEIGEGGRLIGAFAYGYRGVLDPVVGIQPIELMRDVGHRSKPADAVRQPMATATAHQTGMQTLSQLHNLAQNDTERVLVESMQTLMRRGRPAEDQQFNWVGQPQQTFEQTNTTLSNPAPVLEQFKLPISVGSTEMANLLTPLLSPHGLMPVSSAVMEGTPMPNIKPEDAKIKPGSVFTMPLAWGDMYFAGTGTTTDVLPDGRALAFGHASDGWGDIASPMGTGYVHFIVANREISFKLSGGLQIAGTVTRDENSAVVGVPGQGFETAPMHVKVDVEGQPIRHYNMTMADSPTLAPVVTAVLPAMAAMATQNPPMEHMPYVDASIEFSNGRVIEVSGLAPGPGRQGIVSALLPAVSTMIQNPFERLRVTNADVSVRIVEGFKVLSIRDIWVEDTTLEPGDTFRATVMLEPHMQEPFPHVVELTIPEDVLPGDYQIAIGGASTYQQQYMMTHPYEMRIDDLDQLGDMVQLMNSFDRATLYATMTVPRVGAAVKREAMPKLPGSMLAMMTTAIDTRKSVYVDLIDSRTQFDSFIAGNINVQIKIVEPQSSVPQP